MPFESKPISVERIEGFVKDKQESTQIEFDELEKSILDRILGELPSAFNTVSLTKFCKNKVDKILADYPEKKEKSDIIRKHVQREIIFDLYNDRFVEILDAIKEEKPQKINTEWINERFPATALLIKRTFKDSENNVDWDYLVDKLNIKDIFVYQERKFWGKDEAINELKKLLEKEKPETFSSKWIKRNNESLYSFFNGHFRNEDGSIDWGKVVENLGVEWKNRWTYRESERGKNLNDVLNKLQFILREKNPESFGPNWLLKNCSKEYQFIQKWVRNTDGVISWDMVIDSLPIEWKDKWQSPVRGKNWSYDVAIEQLKILIKNENPNILNSKWIESKDKDLYMYFLRNIRSSEGIYWEKILSSLPKKWQDKWQLRNYSKEELDFKQAIFDLKEIIKQKNPKIITSGFIGEEKPTLLSYFIKNIKDDNGEVDWRMVVNSLDDDLKKICRFPKKLVHYKPQNEYINDDEVNNIIDLHKNKLYTFFEILNKEDNLDRDKICLDFLRLVQRGNVLAKEKFLDYLEILVTQWVEEEEELKIFIAHGDLLRERIEKCIYYCNTENSVPFIKYLHTNLSLEGKGLETPRYIRLNHQYKDSGDTIESRINLTEI